MSVLTDLIYGGSNAVAGLTEGAVNDAIAKYGADKEIAFPDTAYFFPTIYAATGVKVKTLGDLPACVGVLKSLITNQEDLGQALNAGLATAVGAEILEGLKYVDGANPYENESGIGFVPDPIIRSLGVPLVTGDIPGVAVVLGKADNAEDVVKVVKDYQSKGIMTFMVGDVIEQCAEGGVKMGLELRVIPLGHDVTSVIHVVTVAIRAALIFGNVQPGNLAGLLDYTKNRVPAFVNTFGAIDSVVVSAGAGAIALGFPVVVDIDLGENQVPGALESVCDHAETVKKSLELRNIKIKVKELPIPVAFAAAFEGEIIRKADVKAEFWSAKNPTAELVVMRELNEIEDHKITIVGPDFDQAKDLALATYVEVAGKKMQVDFESVIERKFHAWFNYMEGVMHTGWLTSEDGLRYYQADGTMVTAWQEIGGKRYYFGENGAATIGWYQEGEYNYYFLSDGSAAVGPTEIDGETHFFTPKGMEVILVNAAHPIPSYYTVNPVIVVDWHRVDQRCYEPLMQMLSDCSGAGIEYIFNCGYRTMQEQTDILEKRTQEHMKEFDLDFDEARKKALETVAVPGTSEHQMGLAVDISGEEANAWLAEHCWEYGFILRYTDEKQQITGFAGEAWHIRYVGREISMDMKDSGLCLEEYLGAA